MVIECPYCRTRYTLSPALIRGSLGARVRCRKCGDGFEVRNPEMPPPLKPVESPRMEMESEKKPRPPEPSKASTVALKISEAGDSLSSPQYQYRGRESQRSGGWGRTRPAGGKAVYYLAGSIVIVLGITWALLLQPELRWGLSALDKTSQDVYIASGYYTRSPQGAQIFVLQGSVRDTRKGAASAPLRLRVRLFNAEKGVLADKTFLAGPNIPGIGFPPEIALENTVLKEGWLPFVVTFLDPGVIADFSVTIDPT